MSSEGKVWKGGWELLRYIEAKDRTHLKEISMNLMLIQPVDELVPWVQRERAVELVLDRPAGASCVSCVTTIIL